MKILIIGGSGVIGYNLLVDFIQEGMNTDFTYFKHKLPIKNGYFLDITKRDDTIKVIDRCKPDVVIHTVGITNVDLCENDHKLADKINVKGTLNVIEGCKKTKSKLIFLSTSAVFDGTKSEYFEDDLMSPISYYGFTKKIAEEEIKKSRLQYIILRIDQPYFWTEKWHHTNSVLRVLEGLKETKNFEEISDWYNTPTFIPDIIHAIKKLINLDCKGVYHVVGHDFINRYKWALDVAEIFKLDKNKISSIISEKLDLPAKRANVKLNNEKIEKETKIVMKGVKEGLKIMLKNRKS